MLSGVSYLHGYSNIWGINEKNISNRFGVNRFYFFEAFLHHTLKQGNTIFLNSTIKNAAIDINDTIQE